MNFKDHLISSLLFLQCISIGFLIGVLLEYGAIEVFVASFLSFYLFLLGVTLPDWDHPAVQKKFRILWWIQLRRITKHRGHWHSLIAMSIYGLLCFGICFFLNITYWQFPTGAGMVGFLSHLIEDDLNRPFLEKKPKRGFKIW